MKKVSQKLSKSMVLSGREFSPKEVNTIIEIVNICKGLSRQELCLTVCENLDWKNEKGTLKIRSAEEGLLSLERKGLLILPALAKKAKSGKRKIQRTDAGVVQPEISCELNEFSKISLSLINTNDQSLFNEMIDRYHYLGYAHSIGSCLKYWIIGDDKKLGCLLFSGSSACALEARDRWIGWNSKLKQKNRNRIICNNRFLIFPWVKIPNLASHILSNVSRYVLRDWEIETKITPVLIETFVDPSKYLGTSYKASKWEYVGETTGRGRTGKSGETSTTKKQIYMLPLDSRFREILQQNKARPLGDLKNSLPASKKREIWETNNHFQKIWTQIAKDVEEVADEYGGWQKRHRIVDTFMLVMLIFRIALSRGRQSYALIIESFWNSSIKNGLDLPQSNPIAPSSFSRARNKLDSAIFCELNKRFVKKIEDSYKGMVNNKWYGWRLFAVDGSKVTVPREMISEGYRLPNDQTHYPQGMLSVLFNVKSRMPYDFQFGTEANERVLAALHLKCVGENDLILYDRGYLSYEMLLSHVNSKADYVYRIPKNSFNPMRIFFCSNEIDKKVFISPSADKIKSLKEIHQLDNLPNIEVRLIKYTINGEDYCLATSIFDNRITPDEFKGLYHCRWGIEEMYKTTKVYMEMEAFHSKKEHGVTQEIYAGMTLITALRFLSNDVEDEISFSNNSGILPIDSQDNQIRVTFKSALTLLHDNLEQVFCKVHAAATRAVENLRNSMKRLTYRVRMGRAAERKNMRAINKWQKQKSSFT